MRKTLLGVLVILAAVAISGCSADGSADSSPAVTEPSSSVSDSHTSTPSPTAGVVVDPLAYAAVYYVEGVDFDSADGNIHCSIFIDPLTPEWNPRAGCGMDSWDFEFPVVPYLDTERAGNATVIHGAEPGLVFAHSDAPYAGQDPISNPTVGTLHPGETITSVGISCEALTDAIRCTNTTSEHGFLISRDSYELF